MALIISPKIREKLAQKNPPVTDEEVRECFWNRTARTLTDSRSEHRTRPPTRWFIAETATGRRLKIVFIRIPSGGLATIHVKMGHFSPDSRADYSTRLASRHSEKIRFFTNELLCTS
jgi:hypothetical protein